MLRRRHDVSAWALALGVIAGLLTASAGGAWAADPAGEPPAAGASLGAPLVDWSHALEAHRLAEDWARAGAVGDAPAAVSVTDVAAVRVTLRMNGFTVGVGDAQRADVSLVVDHPGPPVNLADLTRDATARALTELARHLKDAERESKQAGRIEPGQPVAATPADVGRRVLVDVQVAKRLNTVALPADADPVAVYGAFAPGFHGLRSFDAAGRSVWIWPASAIAANTSPRSQAVQLVSGLDGDPHKVEQQLARPGGPPLQRFEVLHVARPMPTLPPTQLVRGNVVLPPLAINMRTLDGLADQLAEALKGRFTTNGALRGTYLPTSDRFEPAFADGDDLALASYALVRYTRHRRAVTPDDVMAADLARQVVVRLKDYAAGRGDNATPGGGAGAAALMLLSLLAADVPEAESPELRDALGRFLMELRDDAGGFKDPTQSNNARVNDATQALIAAALAGWYDRTRDAWVGGAVGATLDNLWIKTQGNPNIAALPWFVLAQRHAGDLLAGDDETKRATLRERQRVLGDLVDRLCRQQVIEPPVLGPADVVGGFELVRGPAGSPPNPDWRSAQLLSFLASSLREPQIVEGHNAFDWAITGGLAARFLAQLMMDEPSCYYVRSPRDAVGAVRLALWDNRQSVAATAVTLLAVTQLQEALRGLEQDRSLLPGGADESP